MKATDLTSDLKNIETPNLGDYLRLPNACLQVFLRAAHETGIHEPKGIVEAIRQFMHHGALYARTFRAKNLLS